MLCPPLCLAAARGSCQPLGEDRVPLLPVPPSSPPLPVTGRTGILKAGLCVFACVCLEYF